MERTQVLRRFRQSAFVLCLIACLLAIALWVRSHSCLDVLRAPLSGLRTMQISSYDGRLLVETFLSGYVGPTWQSVSLSELDQQLDQALKTDLHMNYMKQQLMYVEMQRSQAAASRRANSRATAAYDRQIAQLNRSIEQYLAQTKQSVLRDERTMIGFVLKLPVASNDYQQPASRFGFSYRDSANGVSLELPHWFVVLLTATFTAALAFRTSWRFSLRTLFIVMTIAAVVLGTITTTTS